MEPNDPRTLRISDADRHQVAEVLREAAGEGRLDVEELEQRLEAAYAAKTYGDLVPITLDLPGTTAGVPQVLREDSVSPRTPRPAAPAGPRHDASYAVMSETKRAGVWTVGESHTAVAVMGSVVLDLRDADLSSRETVIHAHAVMGGVDVIVDEWTRVSVEGFAVMGAYEEARSRVEPQLEHDSPLVRVKGFALMGAVEIRRKGESRWSRKRALGR